MTKKLSKKIIELLEHEVSTSKIALFNHEWLLKEQAYHFPLDKEKELIKLKKNYKLAKYNLHEFKKIIES